MFRFYQITDLHFYAAEEMHAEGAAWEYRAKYDQKCVAESGAILEAAIDKLLADRETDVVLISGDLVSDGEKEGHYVLQKKLRRLKDGGKKVFVLTATHDICPEPKQYSKSTGETRAQGLTKEALLEVYWEFGPAQALSVHKESFSYVAQLAPGYRLLALNDDGVGWEPTGFHGYFESELAWLREQLEIGKQSGDVMFAMGHHPLLPPGPFYAMYSPHDVIGNHEEIATLLADAGVRFMFTGHTHMQNIASFDTPRGNRIFDINTASLIGYPSPIRKMTLTDETMTVETSHIETLDYDLGGKSYMEYSRDHFEYMLRDIFASAANDIAHFCEVSEGFGLPKEKAWKLRVPIRMLGKFLDRLTFRRAGKLLFCANQIAPEMASVRLCDFMIDVVRNLYGGDEPYAPGTPEFDSFMALYRRIDPILQRVKGLENLQSVIEGTLYDSGWPDNDAVLPVSEYHP